MRDSNCDSYLRERGGRVIACDLPNADVIADLNTKAVPVPGSSKASTGHLYGAATEEFLVAQQRAPSAVALHDLTGNPSCIYRTKKRHYACSILRTTDSPQRTTCSDFLPL